MKCDYFLVISISLVLMAVSLKDGRCAMPRRRDETKDTPNSKKTDMPDSELPDPGTDVEEQNSAKIAAASNVLNNGASDKTSDKELMNNSSASNHKAPGDVVSMENVLQVVQRDCQEFKLVCDLDKVDKFLINHWGNLPKDRDDIVEKVFDHLGIRTSDLVNTRKRKKRRVMVKQEAKLWGMGQVPYEWATDKPFGNRTKQVIEGNMAKISSQTCITFHKWYYGIEKDYPGMKPGRLLVGNYAGCWSYVGYSGNESISTCSWGEAIQHELGHALGLQHEHQSPDRHQFIQSNPESWGENEWSDIFSFTMSNEYGNFGIPYDLDSRMSGAFPRRGATNKMGYDTVDKKAKYLYDSSALGFSFLDFKSINLAYKCFERFCKGQTLTCENAGYPTFAGGKCKCLCPPGVAGDRCEKVDTVPASNEWPSGNYALPMPEDTGCPAGTWATGQRAHRNDKWWTQFSDATPELRPKWRHGDVANVYFDFCIKEGTEGPEKLPKGTYCIYKVGDSCPTGPWEEGYLQYSGANEVSTSGTLPSGTFTDTETKLEYCCRFDRQGTYAEPMLFPHKKPFYLFSPTSACQEVQGMFHKRQYVWMSIKNATIVKPIAYHVIFHGTVYMYLCYYYPKTDGPGEVFELTPENPEKILTSHLYPNKYSRGLQQNWLAKVPKGGLVQVEFQDFNVYYNAEDKQCIDSLELKVYGVEMLGRKFCGMSHHANKTVTSKTNYMSIRFLSQSIAGSKGFKIKVKGIFPNQLCYKLSDGGTSYRGTVSYTQSYKPCLPWDKVRHCEYNTFDVRSVGSGIAGNNYCRNPNKITQPWCYIDAVDCVQDVCDACLLDRCHDRHDDCAETIAWDSAYCTTDPTAFSGCHLSCGFCKTPDPVLSCSDPPTSASAIFLGPIKTKYAVGDVVEYECKQSGIKGGKKRTCLSDGTWSQSPSECSGCEAGYEEFDGRCYKAYPGWFNFQEAFDLCKGDNSLYYPASMCNIKKKVLLEEMLMRHSVKRNKQNLHAGITVESDGKLKCTDGSEFVLAKWVPWSGDKVPTSFIPGSVIFDRKNVFLVQPKFYTASVVCEGNPLGEMKCTDRQSDCQQLLKTNPDVCLEELDFARTQCRWSCGACKDLANPGKPCTAPASFEEAVLIGTKTSLSLGETARYTCNSGYGLLEGDLERVCLADGSLGGQDPQCVSEDEMSHTIGINDIYRRDKDDTWGSMNIDGTMKVPSNSKAVAYIFYSKHEGEITFQVWRKNGTNTFILVGENDVTTKKGRNMYVKIAPKDQITLQKGDLFGWQNRKLVNPPLTYVDCVKKYMANSQDTFYQVPLAYQKSYEVSELVSFNLMVGQCRNYSLQIVVHPNSADNQVHCEVPDVPNANVSHAQSVVPEGTEVSITCLPSYTATTGATKIMCLNSGLWSAAHVQCNLDCGKQDVVFLIDSAGGITEEQFGAMKEFAISLIEESGEYGDNGIRVGVVMFGKYTKMKIAFELNTYSTKDQVIDAIRAIVKFPPGQPTHLFHAISSLPKLMDKARTAAQAVLVILTDGKSKDERVFKQRANEAIEKYGVSVFPVGITSYRNEGQLEDLAGKNEMTLVQDFDTLADHVAGLADKICHASPSAIIA